MPMPYLHISPYSMVQGAMFTSSTQPSVTISTKAIICACPNATLRENNISCNSGDFNLIWLAFTVHLIWT